MRTVITGGSGLIGRALTQSLAAEGQEVVILSRNPDRVTGLPSGARAERWDGTSAAGWGELVADAAVVHLAGAGIADGRWTAARKKELRDSRVDSSRAVAEAIAGASTPPTVLVQGSAVGFYGSRGDEEISEASGPGDDFLAEICQEWENATEGVGVRRAVIRTGVVLSTKGGALPRVLLPFKLFAGGPVGSGRQWFPWIHIADQVDAIRFLIDRPDASGIFNLTAPNPVTNKQLAKVLGKVMGRPSFMPTPGIALKIMLGEMSKIVLEGQRAVPSRLLEAGYKFRYPDLEAALRDLLD